MMIVEITREKGSTIQIMRSGSSTIELKPIRSSLVEVQSMKGESGQSAYDIAVAGGFTGTIEEFKRSVVEIPLIKEELDSKAGASHTHRASDVLGLEVIKGPKGDKGDIGPQGLKGEDGLKYILKPKSFFLRSDIQQITLVLVQCLQ